jgi:hypothetical protein
MSLQQQKPWQLQEIEENFSEWSEMGYSLSSYLFELLKKERDENDYLRRRIGRE